MHPNLLNAQEMKQQSQCIIYCIQISAPRRPAQVQRLVARVEATRRGTTSTAKATTLATVVASLATEVTAVAVVAASLAAITPAALAAGSTGVTLHTTGRGARGLLEGVGDNFLGEVQVLTEVLDALVGEVPVVPLPAELLSDVPTGLQGSEQLDDVDVLDGELLIIVLGLVAILLGNHDTLFEEVVVDDLAVLFRDEHCNKFGFDECAPM